jgi:hypothetical protein
MQKDNLTFDPFQALVDHAEHLNSICDPSDHPEVLFEFLSGALVWRDETTSTTPVEAIWALRFIRAYRTKLILGQASVYKPIWDHGLSLFPKWVGFRPERRLPTPELHQIYRRGDVSLRKCLRNIEHASPK